MLVSRIANRYDVEQQLASGGMGVVYRVRDRSTGDSLALKRLASEIAARKELVEAFEREYQVLAGLDHPRIIRVFDYGVDSDGPYYTMELLAGEDLRKAAPLPYRDACRSLRDVATSLALLHARRLLHRDLSPGNVRSSADGHCKLLDFGALAAFGASHLVVGTPPVVPPEALAGAALDQRADLYALGALAYWTLTGRHAYPARRFDELPLLWKRAPPAPSTLVPGIPEGIDELVLSLLSGDPRLRPSSAAEVISRLDLLAELEPEDAGDVARLAESFLLSPRFVGRAATLERVRERIETLMGGHGAAVRIEGAAGAGRSRLLEEIGLRARVAGAGVVRIDASMVRDWSGTVRAIVLGVLEALPQLAREHAGPHRGALVLLGDEVEGELAATGSVPPSDGGTRASRATEERSKRTGGATSAGSVDGWLVAICRSKPLVIEIDNVDDADDASVGLLVALSRVAAQSPLLLVVTETTRLEPRGVPGLVALRGQCEQVTLEEMSAAETLELCRSIFGDAPNVERFAGWLHGHTAGSPLHCVEVSRRLVAGRVLRYIDGMWSLPADRPSADLPEGLEEALLARLASLSDPARGVAECLCLAREQPTMALVRLLVDDRDERRALHVLDELTGSGVLFADRGGYRFGSTALREALLADMGRARRAPTHRRLGAALARLAGPRNPELRIEAGWHLIKGGDEPRGADIIAKVTHDSATIQKMVHMNHHVGRPLEAALQVYRRYRRSIYERAPLLAALAHASYPEGRVWADRYGDEALDACEDLSGVRTARALRRFLGRWPSLIVGILFAFVRFHLRPRRERDHAFREMFLRLFGAVTSLAATAAVLLDVERATHIAETIELFSALPARLAPVGIYEFCVGLPEIGRERQTQTYRSFETLLRRFEDPGYYRQLPADARILFVTGAHFTRGVFATMRADGRPALASADALEASGLRMYAMIACQLRFLYHTYRGELAEAAVQREKAEVHAAHLGSAWQVETWEPAALIPVASRLRDVVALTRIVDRLEQASESIPSLDLYRQLAHLALWRARGGNAGIDTFSSTLLESHAPRSFIGWAQSIAILARAANEVGDHARARTLCEQALAHIDEEDREFVALFLDLDIEMANSLAATGGVDAALARIDGLLDRFDKCDHPLAMGSLHEARARIAWKAGRVAEYVHGLSMVERWFRPTGTDALIAKIERLAELQSASSGPELPSAAGPTGGESASTGTVARRLPERASGSLEREAATSVAPVKRRGAL